MSSSDAKSYDIKHDPPVEKPDKQLWRDLVAFWILGLCNNFGYVVMLSAAHDIIARFDNSPHSAEHPQSGETQRHCNIVSTGAVLLADVIPSLLVKIVMPFIPFWVNTRVISSLVFSTSGFLLVGYGSTEKLAILGVMCTSAACGIGESTFLSYSSRFDRNVLSTWSSGTGGAGIIASLAYAGLHAIGFSPKCIMLILLVFPSIQCVTFWVILREPNSSTDTQKSNAMMADDEKPLRGCKETIIFVSSLCKYMMPLTLVYVFEYFINQGLYELVDFKDIFLKKESQYRWLCVDYQIGVFISRSSVNLVHFRRIWVLSVLQFLNVVYFLTEVIYYCTPSIWTTFAVAFWEGLLGGGAYVNTFYRMTSDISRTRQEFAIGVTAQADAVGIMLAGFLAIPVHNTICKLQEVERMSF